MPLRFSSLMDIDKLIPIAFWMMLGIGFSSLMDIDKLILFPRCMFLLLGFSSLMDIDKLILSFIVVYQVGVLVL